MNPRHLQYRAALGNEDICDFFINWEIQDSRKLADIITILLDGRRDTGLINNENSSQAKHTSECGRNTLAQTTVKSNSDEGSVLHPVQLKAFLHPELTKPSECELRVVLSSHTNIRIHQLTVVSTSPVVLVHDRQGDSWLTAKGKKVPSTAFPSSVNASTRGASSLMSTSSYPVDSNVKTIPLQSKKSSNEHSTAQPHTHVKWFRCVCGPMMEGSEMIVKFSFPGDVNILLIQSIELNVTHANSLASLTAAVTMSSSALNDVNKPEAPGIENDSSLQMPHEAILSLKNKEIMKVAEKLHELLRLALTVPSFHDTIAATSSSDANDLAMELTWRNSVTQTNETTSLQRWLDGRLITLENNLLTRIEQLSEKVSILEATMRRHTVSTVAPTSLVSNDYCGAKINENSTTATPAVNNAEPTL